MCYIIKQLLNVVIGNTAFVSPRVVMFPLGFALWAYVAYHIIQQLYNIQLNTLLINLNAQTCLQPKHTVFNLNIMSNKISRLYTIYLA